MIIIEYKYVANLLISNEIIYYYYEIIITIINIFNINDISI